jgi:hypothetical protein
VAVSCAGGNGSNNGGTPSSGSKSDVASANDTGPVSVITEDPSCGPWGPINDTLANIEKNGWDKRDPSLPVTAWSADLSAQYKAVGEALRNAADQTAPLAKLTPHRVMRELYQQYIAYIRTYADHIPTYSSADNLLITVGGTIGTVLNDICQAIAFRSAAARGPLVGAIEPPKHVANTKGDGPPERFLSAPDPVCADWKNAIDQLSSDPAYLAWSKEDSSIPASSWPPQYKAENDAIRPIFTQTADSLQKLGGQSDNPFIGDLGALAAQYGRAFIQGIPTYTTNDLYLFNVFRHAPGVVSAACEAAGV